MDVDLLMEPTKDFPGIISPKIEASTRTNIDETRHPEMDRCQDSAHVVSLSPPPLHKHPHLRARSQSREREEKEVFAWRKVRGWRVVGSVGSCENMLFVWGISGEPGSGRGVRQKL